MLINMIQDRIENFPGDIGISYVDLITGQRCYVGSCGIFPATGMSKLLLIIEVFNQLNQDILSDDDIITITKDDFLDEPKSTENIGLAYGILRYLHPGIQLSIKDLYQTMTIISDNSAFNILLKIVGIENVNRTLYELGFKESRINRPIRSGRRDPALVNDENYVSIGELSSFFEKLYNKQIISEDASNKIIALLQEHQRTNIMPYNFFETIPIAHQTGFDEGLILDAGIVFSDKPYVLCMGAQHGDTRDAENVMRDITVLCYQNSMGS